MNFIGQFVTILSVNKTRISRCGGIFMDGRIFASIFIFMGMVWLFGIRKEHRI